jgi:O-antigen/teichoic acid export membrane protein
MRRSSALQAALVFGLGGIGFAAANLVLARLLVPTEFAVLALAVAFSNLSYYLAPLGIDGIVLRHPVPVGRAMLRRVLLSTGLVGAFIATVAAQLYDLGAAVPALIFVLTLAGGATIVPMALAQRQRQFHVSLPASQSPNIVLITMALLAAVIGIAEAEIILAGMAVLTVLVCIRVWIWTGAHRRADDGGPFPWGEALAFVGAGAGLLLLVQIDRLLIPHVLQLEELAHYAVVAAVVGSAFRVFQQGVGHTLVPLLRQAESPAERRRLLRDEALLVGVIILTATIALWYLTSPLVRLFVGDKYDVPGVLVLAALVTGLARVVGSFARAPLIALGTKSELFRMNVLGWVSVAISIAGGLIGARWGLAGLIFGVSAGWWAWAVIASVMSRPFLSGGATAPVPTVVATAETMTGTAGD